MHGWREDITAAVPGESKPENLLYIMFAHSDTSQQKGVEFLGRFMERREGRDAPTSDAACDAQYDAIVEWGIPGPRSDHRRWLARGRRHRPGLRPTPYRERRLACLLRSD
jgi:hypothetical protein